MAWLRDADVERIHGLWQAMEDQGREALTREGLAPERVRIARSADVRYVGQSWQLNVPVEAGADTAAMAGAFQDVYEKTYGYSRPDMEAELVALRVVASGIVDRPELAEPEPVDAATSASAPRKRRAIVFRGEPVESCPVYDRDRLGQDAIAGPAVVEEYGTATVVFPGWQAASDPSGNLLLERDTEA